MTLPQTQADFFMAILDLEARLSSIDKIQLDKWDNHLHFMHEYYLRYLALLRFNLSLMQKVQQ